MTNAREFTIRLADLLSRERSAMAEFLLALADFDRRRLWAEMGHSGLFPFLHRELGMSKAAAFYRKTAAELIQRFPEIVEPLKDGRLCISAVAEVAKVITAENRNEVLPRFFHCSRMEAKAVSAAIAPAEAPPRRTVVTAVRTESLPRKDGSPGELTISDNGPSPSAAIVAVAPPSEPPPKRDTVEPLSAELSRVHLTVSRPFLDKLAKARDALSHSHPGAREEEILEAGLDLILARDAKRKGLVAKPRKQPRPSSPDHIPAAVKRAVWIRDGGHCQWPLDCGGICGSTVRVQFDHVDPRARGGASTVEKVRLLCAVHNDLAARRFFGDGWMDRYTRSGRRRGARDATPPPDASVSGPPSASRAVAPAPVPP